MRDHRLRRDGGPRSWSWSSACKHPVSYRGFTLNRRSVWHGCGTAKQCGSYAFSHTPAALNRLVCRPPVGWVRPWIDADWMTRSTAASGARWLACSYWRSSRSRSSSPEGAALQMNTSAIWPCALTWAAPGGRRQPRLTYPTYVPRPAGSGTARKPEPSTGWQALLTGAQRLDELLLVHGGPAFDPNLLGPAL